MLQKKTRRLLYAVLLIVLSIFGTSAVANTKVYHLISEFTEVIREATSKKEEAGIASSAVISYKNASKEDTSIDNAFLFMTIIQGADEEVALMR